MITAIYIIKKITHNIINTFIIVISFYFMILRMAAINKENYINIGNY